MTIYTKFNYPSGNYVYAYIRVKDSISGKAVTPYYIGKGSKKRAWQKCKGEIAMPTDSRYIVILEENLTLTGALAIERRMIKWYGRVDNGTGMLRNKTDGGEGSTGVVGKIPWNKGKRQSKEHNEKISNALKGIKKSRVSVEKQKKTILAKNKLIQKITCEHCERTIQLSQYHKWHAKNCISLNPKPRKRKHRNKSTFKPKEYILMSPERKTFITANLSKFCEENKLTKAAMYQVSLGNDKHHKGWTVIRR